MSAKRFSFSCILIFFIACATATPRLNIKIPGTDMEIIKRAELAVDFAYAPKKNLVLINSGTYRYSLWNLTEGRFVKSFHPPTGIKRIASAHGVRMHLSQDGSFAIVGTTEKIIIWNVEKNNMEKSINLYHFAMAVSPDDTTVLVGGQDLVLLDLRTGAVKKKLKGHGDSGVFSKFILSVDISPNGRYALTGGLDSTVRLWELEGGNEIKRFAGHTGSFWDGAVYSVSFSPDGLHAISGGGDRTMRLWNLRTGKLIRTFNGNDAPVTNLSFSSDGQKVLSCFPDAMVKLWDVRTGMMLKVFTGHSEGFTSLAGVRGVTNVRFTPDNKYALSIGDATLRIWNIDTAKEVAMMVGFDDGEWLAITPEGYYNSSEKGDQYLSVKVGDKKYDTNLFYDVFYRPDIVMAKLRGEDIKDLITITMEDAIKTPPPSVEFAAVPKDTDQPKVKVCYKAKSAGGGIGEVRLFHNGKLVQSDGYYKDVAKSTTEKAQLLAMNSKAIYEDMKRGIAIKEKMDISPIASKSKGDTFEDCGEIDAISGENEVSLTAFNSNNTVQSPMKTISFNSKVPSVEPHLYILSVGIDQYKDSSVNLKYAVKDAKDIKGKILMQASTLYKPQNIHHELLTDKEATKVNILNRVNELSSKIKPTDSFILFVAGHGVLLQNQYFMLTHEYDGGLSDNILISANEIVEMSKKIKSLSQLLIFDTCHAGGVDYIVSGLYDARMSVLAKKMGLHIYASASSLQEAMDGYKGNGLFSHSLLEGLNNNRGADKNSDGKVGVVELGEYSKMTTVEISKKIGHTQTPLIINFGKGNAVYSIGR